MLKQMRNTIFVQCLIARTDTHTHCHRHTFNAGQELTGYPHAIGESSKLIVHALSPIYFFTAATSLASVSKRSLRSKMSTRCAGNWGETPLASLTASGNFAGWAVAS